MVSKGSKRNRVKIEKLDSTTNTVELNTLPSGKAALRNEPQSTMLPQSTNGKSTILDKLRLLKSNQIDPKWNPVIYIGGGIAIIEFVFILLILTVP